MPLIKRSAKSTHMYWLVVRFKRQTTRRDVKQCGRRPASGPAPMNTLFDPQLVIKRVDTDYITQSMTKTKRLFLYVVLNGRATIVSPSQRAYIFHTCAQRQQVWSSCSKWMSDSPFHQRVDNSSWAPLAHHQIQSISAHKEVDYVWRTAGAFILTQKVIEFHNKGQIMKSH